MLISDDSLLSGQPPERPLAGARGWRLWLNCNSVGSHWVLRVNDLQNFSLSSKRCIDKSAQRVAEKARICSIKKLIFLSLPLLSVQWYLSSGFADFAARNVFFRRSCYCWTSAGTTLLCWGQPIVCCSGLHVCPEYLALLTEILNLIYPCKRIEKLNICIFPNIHLPTTPPTPPQKNNNKENYCIPCRRKG